MRLQLKPATLALAVAFAFAAPLALAEGTGISDPITEHVNVKVNKSVTNTKDVAVDGKVKVKGTIKIKSDADALTKTDQTATNNTTDNEKSANRYARINGNAGSNASGNVSLNVGSGDNNSQANNSALAALDQSSVFGHADSETYVDQHTGSNHLTNFASYGTANASMTGNALKGAQGNLNANVVAGDSNTQANSLAAAVGNTVLAEASAISFQETNNNGTDNNCMHRRATFGGSALSGASGNVGVNIAAGGSNVQSNALSVAASMGPSAR